MPEPTPEDLTAADAYEAAYLGRLPVPVYRVTTGVNGEFVAVVRPDASPAERAAIAGDCRRRYELGARMRGRVDPFADVRHRPWVGRFPDDRQQPTFPCPVCSQISVHPQDVAARYCTACRRFTGDPDDPTPERAPDRHVRIIAEVDVEAVLARQAAGVPTDAIVDVWFDSRPAGCTCYVREGVGWE